MRGGWAACPLTESGFVRVSCNVRVMPDARTPAQAIALLRKMRSLTGHRFWADDVSPADPEHGVFARVVGYRQVTDAHLIALAARNRGSLATFDRGVAGLAEAESAGRVADRRVGRRGGPRLRDPGPSRGPSSEHRARRHLLELHER